MTLLPRSRRLSGLWRLTFWRKLSAFGRSRDCNSRDVPETCSTSLEDEPCYEPCPPPPKGPCPPSPKRDTRSHRGSPISHPHADPSKLALFRGLSLVLVLPLVLIMSAICFARRRERMKEPREPYLDLPYMRRRTKRFPWGDGNHSLFHNPVKNPVPPHGYEADDPYATAVRKQADN